jgi:hypothetical protein
MVSETSRGLFEVIRSRCAEVTRRATSVRIDDVALQRFAERLSVDGSSADILDPARDVEGAEHELLAFLVALDAINFGSGWFPLLRKKNGMSGYRTIASACRQRFESEGAWSGKSLRAATPESMAELLGQELEGPEKNPGVAELMGLYAQAWRDLGDWLAREHADRFDQFVDAAEHSAERMVLYLAKMPFYQDVTAYGELEVPFYKRAQITVADLNQAFGSGRLGRFDDLDQLTLFADNLVPHVLRCEGVLVYSSDLEGKIESEKIFVVGTPMEVEIRAVALEAVERLVGTLESLGTPTTAYELDSRLWNAGQAPAIKARPRHRARSTFY